MKIQYEIGDHVVFFNDRELAEVGVVSRLCNLGVLVRDSAQRTWFRGYRQLAHGDGGAHRSGHLIPLIDVTVSRWQSLPQTRLLQREWLAPLAERIVVTDSRHTDRYLRPKSTQCLGF